jgi:hypothetical protein
MKQYILVVIQRLIIETMVAINGNPVANRHHR